MCAYQILRHDSVSCFQAECADWLANDEVANNELISAIQLIESGRISRRDDAYLASIRTNSDICACAVEVVPDSLIVSQLPRAAVEILFRDRLNFKYPINWISASEGTAATLRNCWEGSLGKKWTPKTRWLIHSITKISSIDLAAEGNLRQAGLADRSIVKQWGREYARETESRINIPEFLSRKIDEGCLYIWDDGIPRTVIAVSGKTSNVVRISAVYTPSEFRGRRYARSAVAYVCDSFLRSGLKQCILATDDQKPEIARMYNSIGFQVIAARVSAVLNGR